MPFRLEYVFEDDMDPYSKWKEIDISEHYLIDQFEISDKKENIKKAIDINRMRISKNSNISDKVSILGYFKDELIRTYLNSEESPWGIVSPEDVEYIIVLLSNIFSAIYKDGKLIDIPEPTWRRPTPVRQHLGAVVPYYSAMIEF